jgi:methyl-accepting chemotaxis protein
MFVILLLVSIIAVGTVNISAFWISYGIIHERLDRELTRVAGLEGMRIQSWLDEHTSRIEAIALFPAVQGMDRKTALAVLSSDKSIWADYEDLLLFGIDGNLVASTGAAKGNFSDRDYFKQAMAGTIFISQPLVSRLSGDVVIVFSAPVRRVGVVVGLTAEGARENSAAIIQVNASAVEMAAQVQSASASAQALTQMAAALEDRVAQFRISKELLN